MHFSAYCGVWDCLLRNSRQFGHPAHALHSGSLGREEDAVDDVDNATSGHVVCARDASRVDAVILQKPRRPKLKYQHCRSHKTSYITTEMTEVVLGSCNLLL